MRQYLKFALALIMSLTVLTTPVLSFAAHAIASNKLFVPRRERRFPINTPAKPRAPKSQDDVLLQGQTTTPLAEGRLLVIGGQGTDGPIAKVTIKDPTTNDVISLPDLPQPRAWHSATILPNGRVLVLGGTGAKGEVAEQAYVIDPDGKTFEEVAGRVTPRAHHTATLLTDGRVLIAGGISSKGRPLAKIETWDFKSDIVKILPGKLGAARQKHTATLLSDGNVLFEGGTGSNGDKVTVAELCSLGDEGVTNSIVSSAQTDVRDPYVAGALPEDGAINVPADTLISLRFSNLMRAETFKRTIKLLGPAGAVEAKIVPAEGGRLAFVALAQPLQPGTTYALSVTDLPDVAGRMINSATVTFTTFGKSDIETVQAAGNNQSDDEDWNPDANNLRGNWRSKKKKSLPSLPPLQAPTGVTALAGQVLLLNNKPLANVTLQIGTTTTTTDGTGRFLLSSISAGHQVMKLDGRTANRGKKTYGVFKIGVSITAGKTNVLPYTIWMPKLDMAHAVRIPSPLRKDTVITNPQIPGLELQLPRGTVIRNVDGQTVTEISITPIPTNQPPFPLPPNIHVPVFFTIQPGGSQLIPPRARLIYPNFTNRKAGTRIDFWNYDAAGKGWYAYGKGTVSPNGKQIIPDPGVVLYEFSGAMVANPDMGYGEGPGGTRAGDPVDLSTGLFVYSKTDLALQDVIPIALSRTYRPRDSYSEGGFLFRPFGYGTSDPYDIFLVGDSFPWTYVDLNLADGARVRFDRTSPGTEFYDAEYEASGSPGMFHKSRIYYNGNGWDLKLRDGTVFSFPISINTYTQQEAALSGIQDRYGNKVTLVRENIGFRNNVLKKIISPNGRWIELQYDSEIRITRATDNTGRVALYEYDSLGRLTKATDPKGGETEYTYDSESRMLTVKDPRGIVFLTNEYDSDGNVFRQTQADSSTYEFAYTRGVDDRIVQTDVTDPRGYVRRVSFNSSGYMISDTLALGTAQQQTYTYVREADTNRVLSITDPLNRKTAISYNSAGEITSITRLADTANAVTMSFTYESANGQVATITDHLNHTVTFSHDSHGNLTSVSDPLNNESTFTYNSAGQMLTSTDALNHTVQFTYDAGNLVAITDPLGRTMNRYTDAAGRASRLLNPLGQLTRYEFDALDQVTRNVDPLQGATAFAYDGNGNVTSITDARNNVMSYIYNNMDRLITRRDALLHDDTYEYDLNGNLTSAVDREGQITSHTYDALNRLTQTTYHDSSTRTYTYDAGNRITQIVDSVSGTITYTWDGLNRVTNETSPQGSITYAYDKAGRRTSMTVTGETPVTYTYDNADRLTAITQGSATVSIAYDAASRRTSVTLPNGVVTEYGYDAASQVTSLTYKYGATVLGDLTYTYDVAGRRVRMGGTFARTTLPAALGSATYDAANRQTAFGSQNLTYDLNGNLESDGTNTYTWDVRGRLAGISGPSLTASFEYDAVGRRVSKTVNGTTTDFLYDGANVVQEQSALGNTNIVGGGLDETFTRSDSSGTVGVLADALGSSLSLTNSSGAVQTEYTYGPFGHTTTSGTANSNSSHFTGRENDGTGLQFNRWRYFSPLFGRFLSEDPLGTNGGDVNLYAYVGNNPISLTDPLGLDGLDKFFGAVRTIGGALEVAAGVTLAAATSWTGIGLIGGGAVALHGLDQVQAGLRQMFGGGCGPVDSFTSQGLQALGMSQSAANMTDTGLSMVGSAGAGVAAQGVRAGVTWSRPMEAVRQIGIYEAGSTTISQAKNAQLPANVMERGAQRVAEEGWMKSLLTKPSDYGQFRHTVPKGFTPAGTGGSGAIVSGLSGRNCKC